MSLTDKLVIIKKKGGDGMTVPLDTKDRVLFGRSAEANIRIQKKAISSEHTEIVWDKQGLPMLRNLSKTNATLLNGENLTRAVHLHDGDLITIVDRSFRFKSERAVPAERTPLVERKRNVVKNTPKGSALKQSATPKAKQNDENEQVAKQLNFNGKRKSSGSSKKPKMKQPVTYNKLNTPLKHSIVEKATARTSIVPDKALQTPMKNEIVAKGSKVKPAYAAKKMLETPMRNEIKKNGGKAKPAYADKKSLQTPVKKAIREKGSKAKPMYAEKKALDSPMQREIQANGGKAKPMYAEKKALDSPMKSEIKRKGAAEKPMYADKKSLQTPMKKAIRQKGSKAGAAYQYVDNKMATPVKRELTAKAQAIEEKIAAKKAEEAAKQAEQAAQEEEEEVVEEQEEEAVVEAEEQQDDDDKTIDEEEDDDESDEESSDDEIMFNLPTHKTPVKQETARRLGTPMRDALVARATQPRPAYLREHTLASPLRSSIVNKSSTVVEMHRSRFGGLPTPVKKAIGPAAFDFASRAMALASAKAAASAAVVTESVDEAVEADVSVENDAAVETPVTMLSVDISAAKQDMEQVLEDIEGKMGARGYTKAKMEADMKSLIASVREVFDKLTIAETTVDEDVEEKIAAIEQVEEQVAEEAEEQAQVEEQVEQQEEVKEAAEEEEKEEEKPAPKRRGRGRKSVAAVVEPEVVEEVKEEVKEEEVEEKVEVKTTRRGRRASTRKSIAVEEPVEEEEEQVEEEVEKVEEKEEEEQVEEEKAEEEVKPKRATRGRRSTAAAADVVAPSTRRRSTRSRK